MVDDAATDGSGSWSGGQGQSSEPSLWLPSLSLPSSSSLSSRSSAKSAPLASRRNGDGDENSDDEPPVEGDEVGDAVGDDDSDGDGDERPASAASTEE